MAGTYCALVLAGGLGTRLWPRSRRFKSKQFLRIEGERTLLQQTIDRIRPIFPWEHIWVVSKPFQKDEVTRQVPELPEGNLLLEPVPKGTAAAVSWATALIQGLHPGCTLAVLPSDHLIREESRFRILLLMGMETASSLPFLVTFGLRPQRPETSYGYIEVGGLVSDARFCPCYEVKSFHEKPDKGTATEYLKSGRFLWNSGIFTFSADVFMDSLARYSTEVWRPLEHILHAVREGDIPEAHRLYARLPNLPIDEALFERAENVVVFPSDFNWHDVGLWSSIYEFLPKDRHGNAVEGKVITSDCGKCLLVAEEGLIAGIGLEDMAVVLANDAVLVCPKSRLGEVQELVKRLRILGYEEFS